MRRPLEAVTSSECGPSRAWGSVSGALDAVVARPIRPCSAESSPFVRRPAGNFDSTCRRSSVQVGVGTPRSVTRTLPCHIAESHDFSPPPSPAIAVSATFELWHVWWMRELRARWRLLRVLSEYSLPYNVFPNPKTPSTLAAVLCSSTGWVLGYPVGSTPLPRPRRAQQLSHDRAARRGGPRQSPNRPIAHRIQSRRERPELRRVRRFRYGESAVSAPAESPPPSAVQAHAAARCRIPWPNRRHRRAPAARRRRGRPGQKPVTLRCAAPPTETAAAARARRETPKQCAAERYGQLAAYEAGERQVHPAPPRSPAHPPASRSIPRRAPRAD